MGPSKKHQKYGKAPIQMRTRTTRSRGRPLADPEQNTQLLTEQLRSMGLYAAHTVGDGNCLFRALSDQLHGSPSYHLQLRKDICDWIEAHSQRYEPFCEDERGLAAHLRCMREQGTYGGHLELSAFAHFTRRNVKVIQPGLVYVIDWKAGGDIIADQSTSSGIQADDQLLDARERRRLRKQQQQREETLEQVEAGETVYVAYHDWEHFSSIRNLRGPHTGLPDVCELPADSEPVVPSPVKKKPPSSRAKTKPESAKIVIKRGKNGQFASSKVKVEETAVPAPAPTQIPLPMSRSPSVLSSAESLHEIDVDVLPPTPVVGDANSSLPPALRIHRSPKRTFDESSGCSSDSAAKRTRSANKLPAPIVHLEPDPDAIEVDDPEEEEEESTPELSPPGSSADSRSSSAASSPFPGTPPPEPAPVERPLTRRQRKALGLPKPRAVLVTKRASAGKIIIPGGRFKRNISGAALEGSARVREAGEAGADDEGSVPEEWQRNGTGRLDVRGFRELKI